MTIIDREMKSEVFSTEKSQNSLDCQASFNSDGVITLRNYNIENGKDSDEIIILSAEETQAIIRLFSRMGGMIGNKTLPF